MADRTVYVSGCLGLSMETGKVSPGGAVAEAELALTHLKNILLASGSRLENVVKTTVFLQNFDDYPGVNDVYKQGNTFDLQIATGKIDFKKKKKIFVFYSVFVRNFPARTCIQVAKLPLNALVEIEAIALVGDVTTESFS